MGKYLRYLGILIVMQSSVSHAGAQNIATTGTPAALITTYGTASASSSFSVSGTGMQAGILVTAPAGFLVSLNNTVFSGTLTVSAAGNISPTIIYVELAPSAAAGSYLRRNVVLSSTGAVNVNVVVNGTVSPAALTITANNANKTYGTTITGAPGSTAFTTAGLQNGEIIGSVTIFYSSGSAAADQIGTYVGCVIASTAAGGSFNPANYTINYSPGEIIVSPALLTISVSNVSKVYGTAITPVSPSSAFTATGLQNGQTISGVTLAYGPGAAATDQVGTYIGCVTASGAAGPNFTPTNYVINYIPASIIVSPASLTINTVDVNKTYGAVLTGYSGSTAFTATGLQNGEVIGSITIAYSTGAAAAAPIGTYVSCVIPSAALGTNFTASNYIINYIPANIIVSPATLTITANTVYKTYGATITGGPGSTAFTATGLQNGEVIGSVTLVYGTGSAATDPVGTYTDSAIPSEATGGTYDPLNYIISYAPGNIEVGPAVLTITAVDQTRLYGENNPVFTVTYSGFVNNEGPAQLSALPSVTTTATASSLPGQYTLEVSGAIAANYAIVYVPGILTITASPQLVKIPNAFSPNGDGINDTWNIQYISSFPNCKVLIFNRAGQMVYTSVGYAIPWNGTLNGSPLPTGTYYYVIDLKNGDKPLAGYVSVIK